MTMPPRRFWWFFLALIPAAALICVRLYLIAVNAWAGCYPWSPSVVEYVPHMTLCPGQTMLIRVPLQFEQSATTIPGI
jgi:hypothetical protein